MSKIVKKLDDNNTPAKIEHIGLRLWRANQQWQTRFIAEMIACGHAWFGAACAGLIAHIDREGTSQSELVMRLGLSKQAVQQLLDSLAGEGVIERRADAQDARIRLIHFTAHGLRVLADANVVKRRIEAEYEHALGPAQFAQLSAALELLLTLPAPSPLVQASTHKRKKTATL